METVNVWDLADRKKMMNRVNHAKGANTARVTKRRKEMSKSILVIDTPECCCQCRFSGADGDYCCLKENMVSDSNAISEEEYLNKKPDWCPLQELPEKRK